MTMRSIIIGSTGGIGSAFLRALSEQYGADSVIGLSRASGDIDLTDEASIAAAAARCATLPPPDLVIVATGMLHDAAGGPEKSLRELDAERLAQAFAINVIGPALVAKHFLPLFARDKRGVFAALSARVGSISDNRIGGWYGYRAAKAALNMTIRNLAIEWGRTHKQGVCVGLHPGTVDTPLSKPFQKNVVPERLFTPEFAAEQMLKVVGGLTAEDSGKCFAWDGAEIQP
jgi:NAD(P)-dependent dehydrogenase (short-subunit alcohol dehydrogenase family)